MPYETLEKISYRQPGQYEAIYEARLNDPETVRLDFEINGWTAFVVQNSEVYRILLQIQKIDKQVQLLCKELPRAALRQFAQKCLVDEIVLTNDIEGVNSTRREISEVLEQIDSKSGKRRFYGLVRKYLMLQEEEERKIKTCQDVRNIYNDLVLKEVIAENSKDAPDGVIFRKDSVSVSNAAQKEIHRGLYPENKIIEAMDHALAFLNGDSCDPLVRISVFHYLVGYIHPFYNGNGRLSRFISSYLLSDELNFLIGYRLSYTVKDNIKQYYDSFKVCNSVRNRGDLTPFVLSFLDIVQKAMKQLEAALLRRKADYGKYMEMISQHPFGEKEKDGDLMGYLIQASLFSGHGIATKALEGMLGISYTPLKNRLSILRQERLLVEEKIGREKFYRLNLTEFEKQIEKRD